MKIIVFAVILAFAYARPTEEKDQQEESVRPFDCPPCTKECPKLPDCPFGKVKDRCGCCDLCGAGLNARCDLNGQTYKYGSCGRNMVCRLHQDPEHLLEEIPLCSCLSSTPVCGNNNETYESICQLTLAKTLPENKGLEELHVHGPCRTAPKIKTAPMNTKKPVGNNVFLSCEAKGWPIPTIEWIWKDSERETRYLPTDDLHISVNNRGGPEKYMITGWLQIMNLQEHHEGDFTCVAQNDVGMDSKTARVNIDIREKESL